MNIETFSGFAAQIQAKGLAADTLVTLGGDKLETSGRLGGLRARLVRNLGGRNDGFAVRTELLNALNTEFGSQIPESVLKAMKLDERASGFKSTTVDGRNVIVATDHPLTARRLQSILDAAVGERIRTRAHSEIKGAMSTLVQMIEDDPRMTSDRGWSRRLGSVLMTLGETLCRDVDTASRTSMRDMEALRDGFCAKLDKVFELHGLGIGEHEEKQAGIDQLRAEGRKLLHEIVATAGRTRFSAMSTQEMLQGGKNSFLGDAVMARYAEKVMQVEIGDAFKDEPALDAYIRNQIDHIVSDGCRGQTVQINGRMIPVWDKDGTAPARSQENCRTVVREMVEELCRDPETQTVDKKSLAMMLKTMNQRLMYLFPLAPPAMAERDGVLPTQLQPTCEDARGLMSTNITTVGNGEWRIEVKMMSYASRYTEGKGMDDTYFLRMPDGVSSKYGFETTLTVQSGLFGDRLGQNDPKVTCHPDKTIVRMDLEPLATRSDAEQIYRDRLEQLAKGMHPDFERVLDDVNCLAERDHRRPMAEDEFKSWIVEHRAELLQKMIASSEETLSDFEDKTVKRGYPILAPLSNGSQTNESSGAVFYSVYKKHVPAADV